MTMLASGLSSRDKTPSFNRTRLAEPQTNYVASPVVSREIGAVTAFTTVSAGPLGVVELEQRLSSTGLGGLTSGFDGPAIRARTLSTARPSVTSESVAVRKRPPLTLAVALAGSDVSVTDTQNISSDAAPSLSNTTRPLSTGDIGVSVGDSVLAATTVAFRGESVSVRATRIPEPITVDALASVATTLTTEGLSGVSQGGLSSIGDGSTVDTRLRDTGTFAPSGADVSVRERPPDTGVATLIDNAVTAVASGERLSADDFGGLSRATAGVTRRTQTRPAVEALLSGSAVANRTRGPKPEPVSILSESVMTTTAALLSSATEGGLSSLGGDTRGQRELTATGYALSGLDTTAIAYGPEPLSVRVVGLSTATKTSDTRLSSSAQGGLSTAERGVSLNERTVGRGVVTARGTSVVAAGYGPVPVPFAVTVEGVSVASNEGEALSSALRGGLSTASEGLASMSRQLSDGQVVVGGESVASRLLIERGIVGVRGEPVVRESVE